MKRQELPDLNANSNGIWRVMPSAAVTEMIAQSGFNFQILDCEHGAYDFHTLENDIRACELHHCSPFVRVSGLNKVEVQRCLDLGAHGIVFPQLTNLNDVKEAVRMMEYAPIGIRGYNPFVRACDYGSEKARKALCIIIIETLEAIAQLEDILKISEIDGIYIGSYDLSAQMDCLGRMDEPKLKDVVSNIIAMCRKASKPVGMMAMSSLHAHQLHQNGVTMILHAVDSYHIKNTFQACISASSIEPQN